MKKLKQTICLLASLTMCFSLFGCNSDGSPKGKVTFATEGPTTDSTEAETEESDGISSNELEAQEVIANNNYTEYDWGCISLELPWLDRRYPQEVASSSEYFYCNQGGFDPNKVNDLNSIYIDSYKKEDRTIESSSEWFEENCAENNREIYKSELLNNAFLGEVQHYKFRAYKNDRQHNVKAYYTAYRYTFYDRDRNLIELEIQIPEDWSTNCESIANHIYQSIKLPEGPYPENDFLAIGDNKKIAIEYRDQGKYSELYELLQQHLKSEGIKENDSAHKAIEILDKIMPYMDSVNIEYDEIDEKGTIKYKSVEDISSEIHVVPIAYTGTKGLTIKVGFEKSDWLFFDKVTITGKEDNWSTTLDYNDNIRDSLYGGIIRETYSRSITAEDLINISQNDDPIIRFANQKEDNKIDYHLSQDEINAAEVIVAFETINTDLSDLIRDYVKYEIK